MHNVDEMQPKAFHVGVKGVLRRNGRVLVLSWDGGGERLDLPGGRIEGDEDPVQTLRRELAEEIQGISNIRIGRLLGCVRKHDYQGGPGLLLLYHDVEAELPERFVPTDEHTGWEWMEPVEAAHRLGVPFEDIFFSRA